MSKIEDCIDKIVCGDCLKITPHWPDRCVDLTVTSPPYDDFRDYHGYEFDFEGIAKELYRITKDGGVVVWVVGDMMVDGSETGTSFRQALYFKDIGFTLHDTMIYAKRGFAMPSSTRYHQVFEYMFVFSKGRPRTFNPIKDRKNLYRVSGSSQQRQQDGTMKGGHKARKNPKDGQRWNIWEYGIGGGVTGDKYSSLHPAAFPEKLAADHIKSWTNEGDLVFDGMCGSGTTCKMAWLLRRKYIGIEISPKYSSNAAARLVETKQGYSLLER